MDITRRTLPFGGLRLSLILIQSFQNVPPNPKVRNHNMELKTSANLGLHLQRANERLQNPSEKLPIL